MLNVGKKRSTVFDPTLDEGPHDCLSRCRLGICREDGGRVGRAAGRTRCQCRRRHFLCAKSESGGKFQHVCVPQGVPAELRRRGHGRLLLRPSEADVAPALRYGAVVPPAAGELFTDGFERDS